MAIGSLSSEQSLMTTVGLSKDVTTVDVAPRHANVSSSAPSPGALVTSCLRQTWTHYLDCLKHATVQWTDLLLDVHWRSQSRVCELDHGWRILLHCQA